MMLRHMRGVQLARHMPASGRGQAAEHLNEDLHLQEELPAEDEVER